MKLERVFPLEDPPVELPWGLSRSGVEAALRGAELGALPDGRLRVRCRLLGGMTTMVDLHFGVGGQRRFRQVELLRKPVRHKRKEFNDLQRRLEAWLGPSSPMEGNPAAQADNIVPQQWQIGALRVTHDYYYQSALYEKVLFDWSG